MSYTESNYSTAEKVIANMDKVSSGNQSKVINSPWGRIRGYKTDILKDGTKVRRFSVSGAKYIHNGGNYRFSTLREKIALCIG